MTNVKKPAKYRVRYCANGYMREILMHGSSAQDVVCEIREKERNSSGVTILEVSKVVNNWK